jgi:hypothetical protein
MTLTWRPAAAAAHPADGAGIGRRFWLSIG